MARIDIPDADRPFQAWANNFALKADLYETELGLTAEEIASITDAAANFHNALLEAERYQNLAESKTALKVDARKQAEAILRSFGKVILADDRISVAIKAELGMKPLATSPAPLVPVTSLVAMADSNGINNLRWDRNGNSVHTQFIVEAKVGAGGEWMYVGSTSKVKFAHKDQIPGQTVLYRVRSQRGDRLSAPSNIAIVYQSPGARTILDLQAA